MRWRWFLFWLLVQLISLALSATETPFSAHYPSPPERLAAPQLAVVQVSVLALIFPVLLQDLPSALFALASAVVMLMLAALLSATPWPIIAAVAGLVFAWHLALYLWNQIPRSSQLRSVVLAIAAAFTLTGPIMVYLQPEYGNTPSIPWIPSPIEGVLAIFDATFPLPATISLLLLIFPALAIVALRRRRATASLL